MNKKRYAAEELAEFSANLRYDGLPTEVRERAKDLILDTVGVALFGATSPWSKAVQTVVTVPGPCVVIGTSLSTSPGFAALANGVAAHSYDFDDVHNESITHPAAAIVPAILAVGQERRVSGRTALTAFVAGYEVLARVGIALVPLRHRARGFHPTGTCGPFGAATASGVMLGLDSERLTNALGIAGSCAAGLMEYWAKGAMTKRIHPGLGAQNGVLAASLAAAGFTGPPSVFEGGSGVLKAYTDNAKPEKLTDGLGKTYEILNSQIKLYANRSGLHTTTEALLNLINAHAINPDDISEITVGHVRVDRVSENSNTPTTTLEAQLSLPFSVAVAAYERAAGPAQYTEKQLSDPRILALAARVRPVFSDELFQVFTKDEKSLPSTVEIIMNDGKRYFERVDYPADGPGNRAPRDTLIRKFSGMSEEAMGSERTSKLVESILSMERLEDISELCSSLAKRK